MDSRVRQLYKELLWLAKNYPGEYSSIRNKVHDGFMKNKHAAPEEITKCIENGEFIGRELRSLYFLRTYRAVKRKYYD